MIVHQLTVHLAAALKIAVYRDQNQEASATVMKRVKCMKTAVQMYPTTSLAQQVSNTIDTKSLHGLEMKSRARIISTS